MRSLNIVVAASGNIPSQWANSINTVRHADAFAQLGHSVELVSVKRRLERDFLATERCIWKHYGVAPLPLQLFTDKTPFYFNNSKICLKIKSVLSRRAPGLIKLLLSPERSMSQYIASLNPDLCFARSCEVVKYNVENLIPTVLETHNPCPENNRLLVDIVRLSRTSNLVFFSTIHETIKNSLVALGACESKVIVNEDAVNKEAFDLVTEDRRALRRLLELPEHKKIIMYLGSLKRGKGIHKIIETAKKIEALDVVFYIVGGDTFDVRYWKEWARKAGVGNVKFTGFIDGSNVPRHLKAADVLFMPYDVFEPKAVMDFNTTSPIKLFEYMAAGRPIVATNLPVIAKVIESEHSALLVDDGAYHIAIERLLRDQQLSQRLASSAYLESEQYAYTARCKSILTQWLSLSD